MPSSNFGHSLIIVIIFRFLKYVKGNLCYAISNLVPQFHKSTAKNTKTMTPIVEVHKFTKQQL